jgi:hypothetical protein
MTVVKSVSDGLRDCESETQLNLNRPLRISPGPRHLSRPLAAISTYANRPDIDDPFIVLTETKFSIRYIPVWARYSPLRTRVEAHAIMLSP